MMLFFKHCFTGIDNATYDLGKVLWALVCVVGLGLSVIAFFTGRPFDLSAFALGGSGLLAAGAASLRLKMKTEPAAQGDAP